MKSEKKSKKENKKTDKQNRLRLQKQCYLKKNTSFFQVIIWIMKVEEICKYCEYLHFTTQMTWTRALLLQGLQAAGGPHITKDPYIQS